MAYVTVYSPDGQKFEVASRDRADKLLLEDGWTQTAPVEEKPKAKPATRKKKKVEKTEIVEDIDEASEDSVFSFSDFPSET